MHLKKCSRVEKVKYKHDNVQPSGEEVKVENKIGARPKSLQENLFLKGLLKCSYLLAPFFSPNMYDCMS